MAMRHRKSREAVASLLVALTFIGTGLPIGAPEDFFYIYDGPAMQTLTFAMLECTKVHSAGIPPWHDRYLLSEVMTELWVHLSLLEHPKRTHDPEEATYFYIPAYFELSMHRKAHCRSGGPQHSERVDAVIAELQQRPYFRRHGGSDHFMICLAYYCRFTFTGAQFDALSRVAIGNQEPGTDYWATWGCFNKVFAVPYAARTDLTAEGARKPMSARNTTFFFRGSARGRPERINLAAAAAVVGNTDIETPTENQFVKAEVDGSYTERILQSRFCFAPRGDTPTSRRIYDAIAAGCIPVLQEMVRAQNDLPFLDQIPYDNFAIIAPDSDFETKEGVQKLAKRIMALEPSEVDKMHASLLQWRPYLVCAAANANRVWSYKLLRASPQLGEAFYNEAVRVMQNLPFRCTFPPPNPLQDSFLSPEKNAPFKASAQRALREQRLAESTFPAVGRTDEWTSPTGEAKIDASLRLLFCAVQGAGGGALEAALVRNGAVWEHLPTEDERGLQEVYSAQWVQVAVVRDPIARLLALYFEQEKEAGSVGGFRALVARLARFQRAGALDEQGVFRPQSSFCGLRYRPFASVLQADRLGADAPALLRALGMDENALGKAEAADAAGLVQELEAAKPSKDGASSSRSCEWTEYYNAATLSLAAQVYKEDFERWPTYSIGSWQRVREACENDRAGATR